MNTCRFCKKMDHEPHRFKLVKYGVRHEAHADCGLKARGVAFLSKLTDWQCTQFPYRAAVEAGPEVEAELKRRCALYEATK